LKGSVQRCLLSNTMCSTNTDEPTKADESLEEGHDPRTLVARPEAEGSFWQGNDGGLSFPWDYGAETGTET
jgi:hypothetical protein